MTALLADLGKKLGTWRKRENDFDFKCPKCRDYKFRLSVNLKKQIFNCFNCAYRGDISILLDRYIERRPIHVEQREVKELIEIPQFVSLNKLSFLEMKKPILTYLERRGVSYRRALEIGMGISWHPKYVGRLIIPKKRMVGLYFL